MSTADFLALLIAWGPYPEAGGCPADLNGDTVVDSLDMLILLDNSWRASCGGGRGHLQSNVLTA